MAARKKIEPEGVLRVVSRGYRAAFAPDNRRVLIQVMSKETIVDLQGEQADVALAPLKYTAHHLFSPDGQIVAGATTRGAIAFFDAAVGGKPLVKCGLGDAEGSGGLFSPDGATFTFADWDGRLVSWEVASGREVRRLELGDMLRAPYALGGDIALAVGRVGNVAWLRFDAELRERQRVPLPDDAAQAWLRGEHLIVKRHTEVVRVALDGAIAAAWVSGDDYLRDVVRLRDGLLVATPTKLVWLDDTLAERATRPGSARSISVSLDGELVAFLREDDRLVIQRFSTLFG